MYANKNNIRESDKYYRKAEKICGKIGNVSALITVYLNLGVNNWEKGNTDLAIQYYENALKGSEKIGENFALMFGITWTDDSGVGVSVFGWNGSSCGEMQNVSVLDCGGNSSCVHNVTETLNCTRGESVCHEFYANDTSNNWNGTGLWCFVVGNTAPNMISVFVNSTSGLNVSSDNLTCWANATDADGDSVDYGGYWYQNGLQVFETSSITLPVSMEDIAIDSQNNIIAVGTLLHGYYDSGLGEWLYNISVMKFYPNGTLIWNTSWRDSGYTAHFYGRKVAVDSSGIIFIVGDVEDMTPFPTKGRSTTRPINAKREG